MPKISPEMTMRDITAAVHRGDLDRRDAEVQAALADRLDAAREAFKEILSLVDPDCLPEEIMLNVATVSRAGEYLPLLRHDPERLEIARRALCRIDDTIGPSEPCKVCFQMSETPP
jgi:hypothetical protein